MGRQRHYHARLKRPAPRVRAAQPEQISRDYAFTDSTLFANPKGAPLVRARKRLQHGSAIRPIYRTVPVRKVARFHRSYEEQRVPVPNPGDASKGKVDNSTDVQLPRQLVKTSRVTERDDISRDYACCVDTAKSIRPKHFTVGVRHVRSVVSAELACPLTSRHTVLTERELRKAL